MSNIRTKYKSKFHYYNDPETVWDYIISDKDLYELVPNTFKHELTTTLYDGTMESVLVDQEQYVLLTGHFNDYAITSYGRAFNVVKNKQLKTWFERDNITIALRSVKHQFKDIFATNNWPFDKKHIRSLYKKYGWHCQN